MGDPRDLNSFLVMGVVPWFAFTMIALAVLVVYGLTASPTPTRTAVE